MRISPDDVSSGSLTLAVQALREGGIVAFPTETFYGLAVDPRSAAAVKRLVALKRRGPDQRLPLIAASEEQVRAHVGEMTPLAARLASRGWPGPLTLIIPASSTLCSEVHRDTGRVAVRVPDHPFARALAGRAGHAITSTSANVSGEPPSSSADQVAAAFGDDIDVLIDAGVTPAERPSTIVDATGDEPILVRDGAIAWERVLEFLL